MDSNYIVDIPDSVLHCTYDCKTLFDWTRTQEGPSDDRGSRSLDFMTAIGRSGSRQYNQEKWISEILMLLKIFNRLAWHGMEWLDFLNFCKLSPFNRWVNKEKNRHFVQIITMMDICYSNFHNRIYKYLVFMQSNSHGTSLKVICHEETWQLIYYVIMSHI